jgi:probable HAF family extracellular repeat protein
MTDLSPRKGGVVRYPIARLAIPGALVLAVIVHGSGFKASERRQQTRYHVTNRSSLGGTISRGNSINDLGWVSGYSNLSGNQSRHATLWLHGEPLDLGTLGGFNSDVAWPVKNTVGIVAGIAQTATPDPLGENWSCSAFFAGPKSTGQTCVGFVWEEGVMRPLPTLGGHNGFATGANNRRQVVGWAENTVHDPTCAPPQVLQFHAVVWGPEHDQIRQLPPLPGDTSGAATAINDKGEVVGISGICDQAVGRLTAAHAVLWHDGTVIDLGNLGGDAWNTPMAINQHGDVVGFLGQAGDDLDNPGFLRAFLWTREHGIRSLGTLPAHVYSEAHGINDRGQVVGLSCDAAFLDCRAFIWKDDVMTDLNDLKPAGYTDLLTQAQDINDRGVITGRAFNPATGERPAFLAIPASGDRRDDNETGRLDRFDR